jgi:GDP-4-dehydro-6-deoxy-D-mannose reductase
MTAGSRILVIGAAGFVGRHLVNTLIAEHGSESVIGAGLTGGNGVLSLDVTDASQVISILEATRPSHVVNLAGLAAPADARRHEDAAWQIHVHSAVGLGRAIATYCPEAWLLHVGSGLCYGRTALHGRPVKETEALEPLDPYGVTKAAGDLAIGSLVSEGVKSVRLRPFNHTGAGQSLSFAVPTFASQIASIEAGDQEPVLTVGNLNAARDFLHVADVTAAYAAVIRKTDNLVPGSVLNVASGKPVSMRDLLGRLLGMSDVKIEVRMDPARQRPSDLATIAGDSSSIQAQTGWVENVGIDCALEDVLNEYRHKLR